MAPKAYLGNYKVFGSSFNPFATDQGIIQAIDDALADGMDIASLSLGGPALSGPLDQGSLCGVAAGQFCDLEAAAVENAIRAGITRSTLLVTRLRQSLLAPSQIHISGKTNCASQVRMFRRICRTWQLNSVTDRCLRRHSLRPVWM
jgi:hypothetical protein